MRERARSPAAPSTISIVMIHGDFGDGFEAWGPASELIGRRYRTVILDRPGVGESLPPDARFSIAEEAASLLQALEEMDLESFHLAGHSYGGLIALEMAITRPERLRSLHLIEPPLLDLLPEDPFVRAMDQRVRSIQADHGENGDEATTEAFFAMIGAGHVPERLRGTPDWQRLCGYAARFACNEPAGDYRSTALVRLPATIPIGLYTGGRSHAALRAVTHELARRFERARLTEVSATGHAVQMVGEAFLDPLLKLVAEADVAWERRGSTTPADTARE